MVDIDFGLCYNSSIMKVIPKVRFVNLLLNNDGAELLEQLGEYENGIISIDKQVLPKLGIVYLIGTFLHEFVHHLYFITKQEHKDNETLAENVERAFLKLFKKTRYFE